MRSFLALELPQDIVSYLGTVAGRLAKRTEGVRWVRNEGIHITVKFLGEIEESMAGMMHEVLAPIGDRYTPVEARLGQLGAFPSMRSARVIVVKLSAGAQEIESIFSDVEEGLEGIHVEREKRGLVPHITLGRRRTPKAFPDGDPPPIEEKDFFIENLVLFKSTLTPGGAMYDPIWKIKLGGEDR
jgi:RNA 2',3'-cyclic 3'-phosphodiesterase